MRIVSQVALGLSHAHSYGFIHRDLKPDNIFLCATPEGAQVRLLDFGSVKLQVETGAKLTALGTTLGSPYYMSPEQATGATDVDERSDVFALGTILYELVAGRTPHDIRGVSITEAARRLRDETAQPLRSISPELPPELDWIVVGTDAQQGNVAVAPGSTIRPRGATSRFSRRTDS